MLTRQGEEKGEVSKNSLSRPLHGLYFSFSLFPENGMPLLFLIGPKEGEKSKLYFSSYCLNQEGLDFILGTNSLPLKLSSYIARIKKW